MFLWQTRADLCMTFELREIPLASFWGRFLACRSAHPRGVTPSRGLGRCFDNRTSEVAEMKQPSTRWRRRSTS